MQKTKELTKKRQKIINRRINYFTEMSKTTQVETQGVEDVMP